MGVAATRLFHVNVNCSQLDRSLAFYEGLVGLTRSTHTRPEPQPGAAFGVDVAQWDAWILTGEAGYGGVVVDLLEWQVPRPTGRPYRSPTEPGFARLGLRVEDLDDLHARLHAAGVRCVGAPHEVALGGPVVGRAFVAEDPDGTRVEFVEGAPPGPAFLVVNTTDLDAAEAFYTDTVGLTVRFRTGPVESPGADLGLDGPFAWRGVLVDDGSDAAFGLLLVEPGSHRHPGVRYRDANHLGLFRLALLTDRIDDDYALLQARGVRCWSPPARLAMGPGLPDLRALLFADPDGATLELIQNPA